MKKQKVKLSGKEVEIQSVPLRELLAVLEVFDTIPDKIKDIDVDGSDSSSNVRIFVKLLTSSSDEIFTILSRLSKIPKKEVEELELAEAIRLFKVLLEVNDIELVKKEFGEISKIFKTAK